MSAQSALSKMSLVAIDPQADPFPITISVVEAATDNSLAVKVSPRVVSLQPGLHTLQWSLSSDSTSGWAIASISGSGIQAQVNDADVWNCSFENRLTNGESKQHFPYTIFLTKTFSNPTIVARIGVDPVIENDPPS
jgi:hypothetical protein